jgi:hypothetical protein
MTPCVDGGRANEVEHWHEDAPDGAALILGPPRGQDFRPPRGTASDDVMSIPGSFDIVDFKASELGLSGYPRAPLLPASLRQVVGGAELMCSWIVTMHQLLKETSYLL